MIVTCFAVGSCLRGVDESFFLFTASFYALFAIYKAGKSYWIAGYSSPVRRWHRQHRFRMTSSIMCQAICLRCQN